MLTRLPAHLERKRSPALRLRDAVTSGALLVLLTGRTLPLQAQVHDSTTHRMPAHADAAHRQARDLSMIGQPQSAPMNGVMFDAGPWSVMAHGWATLTRTNATGPRGVTGNYSTSMASLWASRALAGGMLSLRLMGSAEPTMRRSGYPLLLQTGETADGIVPLRDRQHPHDLVSELAVSYERPLTPDLVAFAYAGPVGAPALGPVPFFHRGSGAILAEAPLGHHLHDATHITHGVLTAGVTANGVVTLEGSLFNGREPDQNRWDIDRVTLDSYALRASVAFGANWALQGSMASVSQPERTHPLIDQSRLSASLSHHRPIAGGHWQTTLAVGRALTLRKVIRLSEARRVFSAPVLAHYLALAPPADVPEDSLFLLFPGREKTGWLLESLLRHGRSTVAVRAERVARDELFDPTDLRHSTIYTVSKGSLAYQVQVLRLGSVAVDAGAVTNIHLVPREIRQAYGPRPTSTQLYARVSLQPGGD